jgi:hypothetical protein
MMSFGLSLWTGWSAGIGFSIRRGSWFGDFRSDTSQEVVPGPILNMNGNASKHIGVKDNRGVFDIEVPIPLVEAIQLLNALAFADLLKTRCVGLEHWPIVAETDT